MPPVVYGLSSGTHRLAQQRLDDRRRRRFSASCQHLVAGAEAAAAGQDGHLLAGVDDVGGRLAARSAAAAAAAARDGRALWPWMLAFERSPSSAVQSWMSLGMVMWATPRCDKRRLDRLVHHVVDVGRPHDALVVDGHVHEQLVEVHVLLVVRADQVVEGVPGDRQHRLAVALGVVQAVEQVDAAGAGGRQADAEPAGVLGVAAGGEGGRLLVPHLDELDLVLAACAAPRRCR